MKGIKYLLLFIKKIYLYFYLQNKNMFIFLYYTNNLFI